MRKFIAVVFLFVTACGGGDSFNAQKSSYGEPTQTSVSTFTADTIDGDTRSYVTKRTGEVEKFGQMFDVVVSESTESSGEILISPYPVTESDTKITLGGMTSTLGTEITAEEPLEIDLDPPVGEAVTITGDFTVKLPGMPSSEVVTVSGSYTLESEDATVTTPAGTFSGLKKYTGSGTVQGSLIAALLPEGTVSGEVYYSPVLGVVSYKINELGMGGNMDSNWDFGDPEETGYRAIRKTDVIDSTKTSFSLATSDVTGEFDADKNSHAKMLLEMRYVDEDLAKTGSMPTGLSVEFGVPFGYFPHQLVESPVSIFHPEENEQGYRYFIAYVDQADKYNALDEISYHINVDNSSGTTQPMRVTARIYYNKIK